MAQRYESFVKFLRGTTTAWGKLPESEKDPNTLYFIADASDPTGKLYLGNKLISCGEGGGGLGADATINDLSDVLISEGVAANSLLVYDAVEGKWINKTLSEVLSVVVSIMTGATADSNGEAGLVPIPMAGDQNKFLKGDGTWADPLGDIIGESDKGKTVRNIAKEEVAAIVDGASEAFDTLKEIEKWINDHPNDTSVSSILQEVQGLKDIINGSNSNEGLLERVVALENALTWQEIPPKA